MKIYLLKLLEIIIHWMLSPAATLNAKASLKTLKC